MFISIVSSLFSLHIAQFQLSSEHVNKKDLSMKGKTLLRVATDQAVTSLSSESVEANPIISVDRQQETVRDEKGEECIVIHKRSADDIFSGMDIEMGRNSVIMSRMMYGINKDRLNVPN